MDQTHQKGGNAIPTDTYNSKPMTTNKDDNHNGSPTAPPPLDPPERYHKNDRAAPTTPPTPKTPITESETFDGMENNNSQPHVTPEMEEPAPNHEGPSPSPSPNSRARPAAGPKLTPSNYEIPANINELDRLDAAKYYGETLGWAVHPLNPSDKGSENERGKKPLHTGWQKHTASDIEPGYLKKHFGAGSTNNIGCVVRPPFVFVDLDSKPDKGESVDKWIASKPELAGVPRERTAGGGHFVFVCRDIPKSVLKQKTALTSQINEKVTSELYCDGLNIVLSPSTHKSGHQYTWDEKGPIPEVSWEELQHLFGFVTPESKGPGRPPKAPPWYAPYPEDLRTLNLKAAMGEPGLLGKCLDPRTHKYAVQCPWGDSHTSGAVDTAGTDTVIFNPPNTMPGFKCLHAHCDNHGIEDLVKYLEETNPGIVARHCTRRRAYSPGDRNEGKLQVVLPGPGRTQSEFAGELGKLLASEHKLFRYRGKVVELTNETIDGITTEAISTLQPKEFVTAIESSVEVGSRHKDEAGDLVFRATSISERDARITLSSRRFRDQLPTIKLILHAPRPFLDDDGDIVYPTSGYDERFGTWLDPLAPKIVPMSIDNARALIDDLFYSPESGGFQWKGEQARTHAIARFMTQFCGGLMNSKRSPLWIFSGNREGVGKDTCAAMAPTLYTGHACTGAPLSGDNDGEMRKRITSELLSGSTIVHFANMKGHIDYSSLEAATDNSGVWKDRKLGASESLTLENKAEFSFSANNATWTPDLDRRSRQIALHSGVEDINDHQYRYTDILGVVRVNRSILLSALAAMVAYWDQQGRPAGPTTFSSFPEWGKTVGGIMTSNGYPDPCLPHEVSFQSGDQSTLAMARFFAHAFERFGAKQEPKAGFQEFIRGDSQTHEIFESIDFSSKGGLASFSKHLLKYSGRELGGITFTYDGSSKNHGFYRFVRSGPEKTPKSPPPPSEFDVPPVGSPFPSASRGTGGVGGVSSTESRRRNNSKEASESDSINYPYDQREPADSPNSPSPSLPRTCRNTEDLEAIVREILAANSHKKPIALHLISRTPQRDSRNRHLTDERLTLTLQCEGGILWSFKLPKRNDYLRKLKPLLSYSIILAHGAKELLLWLRTKHEINIGRAICTRTAAHLLHNGGSGLCEDIHHCIGEYLPTDPGEDETDTWVTLVIPGEPAAPASQPLVDSSRLHDLHRAIATKVESNGLMKTWDLENWLLPAVIDMEANGIHVDRERLASLAAENNPFASGLLPHIQTDNRIRTTYNPLGTVTGRFSSQNPALQSTPRGEIRTVFCAPADRCLVTADYSQIEMRVLAANTGDTGMLEAFLSGEDPHRTTAAAILGKPLDQVTDKDRQLAKAINFGIINGQGVSGMVKTAKTMFDVEITQTEAETHRKAFYKEYPQIERHRDECRRQSKNTDMKEVRTRIGRRRLVPAEADDYDRLKNLLSTPVQGGAADGMKRAMILVYERLPADAMIVGMIHDELIVECSKDISETVKEILISSMIEGMNSIYPEVKTDVKATICSSWGDK